MIKLCRDFWELKKYREYSFKKSGTDFIPAVTVGETCFSEAGELFADGHVLVEVRGKEGEPIFYLKKCRDMLKGFTGQYGEVNLNFPEKGHLSEEKYLDTSLLERANCYLFEELDEYTYEIAELIRKCYPYATIFWLDAYAKYFWDEDGVIILESIRDIREFSNDKFMYICSNVSMHGHMIPTEFSLIYDSKNVINSLCWARNIECLGEQNEDKTILLIDMGFELCGLAYIVRAVCTLAYMAYERGWIPVANLTEDNMYLDSDGGNMWEQYFAPLSDISVESALNSANVIRLTNNHLNVGMIEINPYFREVWTCMEKHPNIVFTSQVKEHLEHQISKMMPNRRERILGALIRGTDARSIALREDEAVGMALKCKEIMSYGNFEKIFLATEDMLCFVAFKEIFGEKLLYVEQKRVRSSKDEMIPIGRLLNIKNGERNNFGLTYLAITYCLSRCEALAYNIASGGFYLANKWRKNAFAFSYHIKEKGTEIETLVKCHEMIENNNLTAVYGAGRIGERLVESLGEKGKGKVVFCDKKAEEEEYWLKGYRVISPQTLFEQYKSGYIAAVIVASSVYAEEICRLLVKMCGVEEKDITVFGNQDGSI